MFVFGLSVIVGNELNISFQAAASDVVGFDQDILNTADTIFTMYDYAFVVMITSAGIGIVISSMFIKTHPVFFILSLLLLIIIIPIAAIFSNVFNYTAINKELISSANSYPMMLLIMNNLPLIIAIFGILVMAGLYYARTVGEV